MSFPNLNVETVPEETELNTEDNTTPIETYAEHHGQITYQAINYDEIMRDHDMAVTAPAHLRHDHDVNINNFVPYHNTLVENIPCDQETQNLHGWVIWCLQFLWHLLLLLLPLQGLQRLPGALATAVEGAISDTCPMVDIIPEDEQPSYFWDILIAVAFIVFAAACYGGGWMHGWWIGRNYILRRRHVRSDRLQRELDGRLREVLDLQGQVVELEQQLRRQTLPAGPITADREIKKLQSQARNLEQSF